MVISITVGNTGQSDTSHIVHSAPTTVSSLHCDTAPVIQPEADGLGQGDTHLASNEYVGHFFRVAKVYLLKDM